MNRRLAFAFAVLAVVLAAGAAQAQKTSATEAGDQQVSNSLVQTLTDVTGVAVSPVCGLTVVGVVRHFSTPAQQRDALPVYCHWSYWFASLLALAALLFKDATKSPLHGPVVDAVEIVGKKGTAVVGLLLVLQGVVFPQGAAAAGHAWADPGFASCGLAVASPPGAFMSFLHSAGMVVVAALGTAVFCVIWTVSHTLTVIFSLVPVPALGIVPRLIRGGILGGLAAATAISPWLGVLYCLVVLAVAALLLGWAVRWTWMGLVFAGDLLLGRAAKIPSGRSEIRAFAATRMGWMPRRTWGKLRATDGGGLEFAYRSFPLFRKKVVKLEGTASNFRIGRGLLVPYLVADEPSEKCYRLLFRLPPRYRRQEDAVAGALGVANAGELGGSGFTYAWRWLKTMLSRKPRVSYAE